MSEAKKIDDGGPAFPNAWEPGMTLREYYAGRAMQSAFGSMREGWAFDGIAKECVYMADALIAALKVPS